MTFKGPFQPEAFNDCSCCLCLVSVLTHDPALLSGVLQKGSGSTKADGSLGRLLLCGCAFLQGKAAGLP